MSIDSKKCETCIYSATNMGRLYACSVCIDHGRYKRISTNNLEVKPLSQEKPRSYIRYVTTGVSLIPAISNVIFNDPATIVFWADGTKTVVKTQHGETFDPEKGLAMAISKKAMGNKGGYYNEFKKWVGKYYIDIFDELTQTQETLVEHWNKLTDSLNKIAENIIKEGD